MPKSIRMAVAVSPEDTVRAALPQMLASAGIELRSFAENAADAMRALTDLRADLLVCDAQLNGCEGSAFAESVLQNGRLPVRPKVLFIYYPEFVSSAAKRLAETGAECVPKPLDTNALLAAVERLRSARIVFPPKETARAERLLDRLGFPPHRGRECLKTAALLCAHDERYLKKKSSVLYPEIGGMLGIAPARVEREIRSAIEAASGSDRFENHYRIFADTLDAERGQLTCGEMIVRLADILRLEG